MNVCSNDKMGLFKKKIDDLRALKNSLNQKTITTPITKGTGKQKVFTKTGSKAFINALLLAVIVELFTTWWLINLLVQIKLTIM